jgi:hypothetical protein
MMKMDCPSCQDSLEVETRGGNKLDDCHVNLGNYRCPGCGKELVLFASQLDPQTVEFRLVDPTLPWTFEEIMNREG